MLAMIVLPLSTRASDKEFTTGQVVVIDRSSAQIRYLPKSTSAIVDTVVRGDELTILSLQTVAAEGSVWWNVHFAERDASGWLPDSAFSGKATGQSQEGQTAGDCWSKDDEIEMDGHVNWTSPPSMVIDQAQDYIATISTANGDIQIELDAENAPIATNNFYCLANAGYYDGTEFHRISEDFLIQGGDPTGTGTGTPGYSVPSDPTTGSYPEGSLALANRAPDENGAQFFIAASDLTDRIPDDYPVFGQVITGMELVMEISQAPVGTNSRGELSAPLDPTTIDSIVVEVVEDEIGPPLPTASAGSASENGGDSSNTGDAPTIILTAKDIAYDPTSITILADALPVTIVMENVGAAEHDFVIDSLDIEVHAQPGTTAEIVIPAGAAPSEYQFYCSIPGHKEAGMVGTLTIESGSSAFQQEPPADDACAGFEDYQNAYDAAFLMGIALNPDATDVLLAWDNAIDIDAALEATTPAEFRAVSNLLADVATEMEDISPPSFAARWHRNEIAYMWLFSEVFATAADSSLTTASIIYYSDNVALEAEEEAALEEASGCPAFVAWAMEDDDEDTWNEARAAGIARVITRGVTVQPR